VIARSALHQVAVVTPAPAAEASPAVARPEVKVKRHYYLLQAGDTLDTVAGRYRTTVHQPLLFNPGIHTDGLVPGQKLRVR
jgi:LysM repeat protein